MKEMTFISVITYAHNVEDSIADFILKIDSFLNNNFNSYEIIIVNDDSKDNTEDEIFNIKDIVKGNVTIVNLWQKHGVDRALFAGGDISIGDFVFEFESIIIDYPMNLILDMYRKSTIENYDIVLATGDKAENLLVKTYFKVIKRLSNKKIILDNSQLRLLTRRALYKMADNKEIITNRSIMYKNCGFEWTEIVYSTDSYKIKNKKRINKRIIKDLKAVMIYTQLFTKLPLLFSGLFLLFFLMILLSGTLNSSLITLEKICNKLLLGTISLGFTLIFLILGIMYKNINMLINIGINSHSYKVKNIKRINKY